MDLHHNQTINLYITHLEKEGPFLKIWGQQEKSSATYVEQFLVSASPQFELGTGKMTLESMHVGTLVCAKYKDNKYYRARIINTSFLHEGFVEVSFLDYGNKDVVPCANVRSLQAFPTSLISVPPLALGVIFAEAHCVGGGQWNDAIFETISKELKFRDVQCTLLAQATQYYLAKLFLNNTDLCTVLIQRGLMQPISLQAQQAVMLSMTMQKQQQSQQQQQAQPAAPSSGGSLNNYKACTLEPGCLYPVYVSYVNDGPCHFSVQLKQSEDVLVMLMKDINSITLRPLEDVPIPGTICLARCQEDGNICRAVVTNEVDNQFKVFYVDFGNYEVVPLDSLYQIPFKYVLPKVMAIRFSLDGIEKSTVTLEMQCAFKTFVDNRLLHMKVLPSQKRMAIPKCELWDPETKTSALDVVNRAARHAYPEPISLNRGFSQPVKISYVYSCNRFYVQLVGKETELASLMQELQQSCQVNDFMDPGAIKVGLPCCALFEDDGQWYRAEIVEITGPDSTKVRYIDYGNEAVVPVVQLKIIDGEQLTVLRPQAIECCLNGYQNMGEDAERDSLLEEIILEGTFTMKVVEMLRKKALVELYDESNYNVASLLLDRLAAAKSQVSPVLAVQAGNKIDLRKSPHVQNNREHGFRGERNPGRENNRNFNNTNDKNEKSWRHDKEPRNYDKNENFKERSSWRENNKGFSPKHTNKERNGPGTDGWNTNPTPQEDNANDGWNNTTTPATDNWESTPPQQHNFDRPKGRFDKRDNFAKPQDLPERGGFRADRNDGGFRSDRKDGGFRSDRNDGGFRSDRNDGGFQKRTGYKKDGELSSSESEKSFQKGPRTSSRNDRGGGGENRFRKNDAGRGGYGGRQRDGGGFGGRHQATSSVNEDSWNVSALTAATDAAPPTATYKGFQVVGTESNVAISWFHNPAHFYCQLIDCQAQFKKLMEEIQLFYKGRNSESSVVGAPVIGLFPEDNVLYRAQVLEVMGNQYKVFYVDFGNVSIINKIWPIEKKFMELPAQAIVCSLHGLKPNGDSWLDPDNYSLYFDKETYICRFIDKDESKTFVNLFYNNEDIAQKLVSDGLSVSTQAAVQDVELNLLLGQQFRGVVKSVNNLSDIIIALQCGLALSCSMHNLETAAETFEDVLKDLLEQTVIVYVDNIIDYRLEVTLYDNQGCKLVILNPDEGSYDTVDAICPTLVLRPTITGGVTHAEEGTVFIQPTEYVESVAVLLDQLFEHYENLTVENTIIPETDQICAIHSEDGNWYRGKVLEFDDDKIIVQYIDYGNRETIGFGQLRELDPKFREMCTLSLQVTCNADGAALIDKDVTATIFYGDNGWEGSVTLLEITPSTTTTSDTGFGTSSNHDNVEVLPVTETIPPQREPKQSKGTEVFMSHVDSPNDFYVQLKESLGAIEELQRNLQKEVKIAAELETPTAGVLCAAPFTADGEWYRAEVLDADDDITSVRFIDFGNTDVFKNVSTKMKSLPSNLLSLAVYATRCTLNVLPPDGEWSTAANDRFIELTEAEDLTAEFLDQDEKKNYVELYSDGKNVKDILIQENLALPVNQSAETKVTGFVSHQNSPSEFWIQLENCVDELEWIAEQLSTAETFPELEDHSPGALCAALFPDDMMWYRARVLSNTVAGVELLFIDYGNSCASDGTALRKLPEELSMTPPLAQKCSLKKPERLQHWSKRMAAKFAEISAEGQAIFTVKKLSTGETSIVELILDDEDVASLLLPETENGHVKDLVGLDNFHIEKNDEMLPDTYRLEEVNGTNWSEDSLEKFKDINKEGTTYQIEFLADNTVCLYLDGRDIKYDLVPPKSPQKAPKADPAKKISSTDEVILAEETNEDSETEKTNKPAIGIETIIGTQALSKKADADEVHIDASEETKDNFESNNDEAYLTENHIGESETSKEVNEVHTEASKKSDEQVEARTVTDDYSVGESETSREAKEVHIEVSEKSDEQRESHTPTDEHPVDESETSQEVNDVHTEASETSDEPVKAHAVSDENSKDLADPEITTSKELVEGHVKDVESIENFHIEKDGQTSDETYKLEQTEGSTFKEDSTEILNGLSNEGRTLFQMEFLQENTVRLYLDGQDIRKILMLDSSALKNEVEAIESGVKQENKGTDQHVSTEISAICSTESTDEIIEEEEGFWSSPGVLKQIVPVADIKQCQTCPNETIVDTNGVETQNHERPTECHIDVSDTSTNVVKSEDSVADVEPSNIGIAEQSEDQNNAVSPDVMQTKTEHLDAKETSVEELSVELSENMKGHCFIGHIIHELTGTNNLETLTELSTVDLTDTNEIEPTKNKKIKRSSLDHDEKILPGCLSRAEMPENEIILSDKDTHSNSTEVLNKRGETRNENIKQQSELLDDKKELGNEKQILTFSDAGTVNSVAKIYSVEASELNIKKSDAEDLTVDTSLGKKTANLSIELFEEIGDHSLSTGINPAEAEKNNLETLTETNVELASRARNSLRHDEKIFPGYLSRSYTPEDKEVANEEIVISDCSNIICGETMRGIQSVAKDTHISTPETLNETEEMGNEDMKQHSELLDNKTFGNEKNDESTEQAQFTHEQGHMVTVSETSTIDSSTKDTVEVIKLQSEQSETEGSTEDGKDNSCLIKETSKLNIGLSEEVEDHGSTTSIDPEKKDTNDLEIVTERKDEIASRVKHFLDHNAKVLPGYLSRPEFEVEEMTEEQTVISECSNKSSEGEAMRGGHSLAEHTHISATAALHKTEKTSNENIIKQSDLDDIKELCENEKHSESAQTQVTHEQGRIATVSDTSTLDSAAKDTVEPSELNSEQSQVDNDTKDLTGDIRLVNETSNLDIERSEETENHSLTTSANPEEADKNNLKTLSERNVELPVRANNSLNHDETVLPGHLSRPDGKMPTVPLELNSEQLEVEDSTEDGDISSVKETPKPVIELSVETKDISLTTSINPEKAEKINMETLIELDVEFPPTTRHSLDHDGRVLPGCLSSTEMPADGIMGDRNGLTECLKETAKLNIELSEEIGDHRLSAINPAETEKVDLDTLTEMNIELALRAGPSLSHDEKVLPGYLSRTDTLEDEEVSEEEIVISECSNKISEGETMQTERSVAKDMHISAPEALYKTRETSNEDMEQHNESINQTEATHEKGFTTEIKDISTIDSAARTTVGIPGLKSELSQTENSTEDLSGNRCSITETFSTGTSTGHTETVSDCSLTTSINPEETETNVLRTLAKQLNSDFTETEGLGTTLRETDKIQSTIHPRPRSRTLFNHDEKILPGYFSRPDTPAEEIMEDNFEDEQLEKSKDEKNSAVAVVDKTRAFEFDTIEQDHMKDIQNANFIEKSTASDGNDLDTVLTLETTGSELKEAKDNDVIGGVDIA